MMNPRILVLRFSALGDVLLTTPALEALKRAWPEAHIYYATKKAFQPLIEYHPSVKEVITLEQVETLWQYIKRLRTYRFDCILDLHDKMRSRIIRTLLGKRSSVWQERPWRDNIPVRLGLRPYQAQKHIAQRYHEAVEQLVGNSLPKGKLTYHLKPGIIEQVCNRIQKYTENKPCIGVSPGATWATKQWPLNNFISLVERLTQLGYRCLVTGTKSESDLAEKLVKEVPQTVNLCGKLDLQELGAVITLCQMFIANDSGPMHMARALGVKTLTFFGSTDPKQFDFSGHKVLYAGIRCSPCHFYGRKSCPQKHFQCMHQISVEQALTASQQLLTKTTPELVLG